MIGGPSAGPSSAYPTLSTPALICFNTANVARAGVVADCACAEPRKRRGAAATPMAAARRNWRRYLLICSGILHLALGAVAAACGLSPAYRGRRYGTK